MTDLGETFKELAGFFGNPQAIQKKEEESEKIFGNGIFDKCSYCLKGGGTRRADGYLFFPANDERASAGYICPERKTCTKLTEYRKGWLKRNIEFSKMPEQLRLKTLEGFEDKKHFQGILKKAASQYLATAKTSFKESRRPPWIFIGGPSGCGKTHAVSAIVNELLNDGRPIRYISYGDLLRMIANRDYEGLNRISETQMLYLDDFWKIEPNDWEMKEIFNLIDFRYLHDLPTLITSEKTLGTLAQRDEAIAGRISEKCNTFVVGISPGNDRNYRIGGIQ